MKTFQTAILLLVAVICSVSGVRGAEVTLEKENIVASRLIGSWTTHADLSKRLNDRDMPETRLTFTEDASVATNIPQKYDAVLKTKQIYLAGLMEMGGTTYPFILIDHHGNPHLLFFREREGDPMGDGESFNLVITPAKNRDKDLLFIGGDFNNQPFSAYERVKND